MVYVSKSNIFVNSYHKIILTLGVKSRLNATASVIKNSSRSNADFYMLSIRIFGSALIMDVNFYLF